MPKYLNLIERSSRQVILLVQGAIIVCGLVGCSVSGPKSEEQKLSADSLPVLEVHQGEYKFSMYPEYLNEKKSKLKLGIRDAQNNFIRTTSLTASLIAKDGHRQEAQFVEDPKLQNYVAEIPLTHHEDYVIETDFTLLDKPGHFTPKFSFHCCDPVPELLEKTDSDSPGGASK